jgi:cell division protein ZapA (FtsZ GTPase activity inhibitor)
VATLHIDTAMIEEKKAALQRQAEELDRQLVAIDRQGQELQRQRAQVVANLNAVAGALELCDELLKAAADSRRPTAEPEMTLEQLKERLGADEVEFIPREGQAGEGEKVQG